jgi:serine/threonine-protein kinase
MPSHPLIGKELGNYVVRSLIGEGGMGVVFAGEHRFLGTRCAIKVLHGSYANNPVVTQRFFQEAKSSLEIDHPNIIKILDLGQSTDGALYLVMELLEGKSLGQAIAEGTFGEGATARIGSLVAEGLAAAHAKGIIHRDLKPDNIFMTGEHIKVLDFGIAKVMQSSSSTKTGSLLGTPQYMAPEQAKGSKHVGPHTDVYALGAILFEMLTGRPPFVGDDLPELLAKQLFEPPPSPRTLVPLSVEMEAIILSCLEKDPTARPKGMLELRDRLKTRIGVTPSPRSIIAPTIAPTSPVSASLKLPSGGSGPIPLVSPGKSPSGPIAVGAPRPYTPTYTPSTIASAASEVMPPSPSQELRLTGGGANRWALIAAAAAVASIIGIGFAVTRKPAAPVPAAAPPSGAAPQAKAPAPVVVAPTAPAPAAPVLQAPTSPQMSKVIVRTDPSGASVVVDGRTLGTTPALLTLALPQEVFLSLKGYRTAHEVLSAPGETSIKLAQLEPRARPVGGPKAAKGPAAKAPTVEKKETPPPQAPRFREGLD